MNFYSKFPKRDSNPGRFQKVDTKVDTKTVTQFGNISINRHRRSGVESQADFVCRTFNLLLNLFTGNITV